MTGSALLARGYSLGYSSFKFKHASKRSSSLSRLVLRKLGSHADANQIADHEAEREKKVCSYLVKLVYMNYDGTLSLISFFFFISYYIDFILLVRRAFLSFCHFALSLPVLIVFVLMYTTPLPSFNTPSSIPHQNSFPTLND